LYRLLCELIAALYISYCLLNLFQAGYIYQLLTCLNILALLLAGFENIMSLLTHVQTVILNHKINVEHIEYR